MAKVDLLPTGNAEKETVITEIATQKGMMPIAWTSVRPRHGDRFKLCRQTHMTFRFDLCHGHQKKRGHKS